MQSRWRSQKSLIIPSLFPCSTLWHAKSSFVILWPDILKTNVTALFSNQKLSAIEPETFALHMQKYGSSQKVPHKACNPIYPCNSVWSHNIMLPLAPPLDGAYAYEVSKSAIGC